jgi:hypothetical protein
MVLQIHNAADQGSTSAQHYFYNLKQFAAGAAKIQTIPVLPVLMGPLRSPMVYSTNSWLMPQVSLHLKGQKNKHYA